jgi:hypothetical protein
VKEERELFPLVKAYDKELILNLTSTKWTDNFDILAFLGSDENIDIVEEIGPPRGWSNLKISEVDYNWKDRYDNAFWS